jgi:7-carboxy-7-deazaguanine synthase (Cx14CxxC type)
MTYSVKEIFYTLQGEGANAGRPAVFCRFAGCNLWNGRESDRATAICKFCDTDFVGTDGTNGGKFKQATDLVSAVERLWPEGNDKHRFVVLTGGEPMMQVDQELVDEFHARGFFVAVETNGTLVPPQGIDWLCVSPKAGSELAIKTGQELKLVFPQTGADPNEFVHFNFEHFYLQPMDGILQRENIARAVDYCMLHPHWKLSVQTHKIIGIR